MIRINFIPKRPSRAFFWCSMLICIGVVIITALLIANILYASDSPVLSGLVKIGGINK